MKQLSLFAILFLVYSCSESISDSQVKAHNEVQYKNHIGKLEIIEGAEKRLQIIWEDGDTVTWSLPYDIYQLRIEDFTQNGNDEILVGVVKKTKFDPNMNKRLFIFKIFEKEIRPLWMGSKVAYPLDHFTTKIMRDTAYIITREIKKQGDTLYGYYVNASFGISWIKHSQQISIKIQSDFQ